jgi:GNAT superfamily N-acetyltransferase
MNIELRQGTLEDAEIISDILIYSRKEFIPYAPSVHTEVEVRNWVRDTLMPNCTITVALSDFEVVGVMAISHKDGVNWVDQMYLAPSFVSKGIGSMFLKDLISTLPQPFRLYTFQQNTGARRLYERYGFKALEFSNGERNEESCPDVLYELS